jgi:plastocyanin
MRLGGTIALCASLAPALMAQTTREVRLTVDVDDEQYRFEPATVKARAGDVLVFIVVNGGPHNVVFEPGGLSIQARDALNTAMGRRSADLSSPLLRDGEQYRFTVPPLPKGSYPFFCLPHRAYDMRGELRIE